MHRIIIIILLSFFAGNFALRSQNKEIKKSKKIVIAHRGASGYLPEHTMESKAMAYAMHPDFIEQDLVLSKDDVPIVIHDIYLGDITNVDQVFPKRVRENGRFYVIDFTYQELLQLDVFERFNKKTKEAHYANRFPYGKSKFKLHSFRDEIELIQGLNKSTGNNIGLYPEIKQPEFHNKNGKDISKIVLKILSEYGYKTKTDNCIVQCFDINELKRVREELKSNLFLVQLIGFDAKKEDLENIANYANGIGPSIRSLIKGVDENGKMIYSELVKNAHELQLQVHAFTFRADQLGDISSFDELLEMGFFGADIDGAFTDFPDKVVEFLKK